MPVIKMNLSKASIEAAQEKLKQYAEKVGRLGQQLTESLTEKGVETAKELAMYMNAYDSGELVNGIVAQYSEGKGYVVSTAAHSAFVEMGTGIRGKKNPNPYNYAFGWTYDASKHGVAGWEYIGSDGKKHWTQGLESRPFMYETALMLKDSAAYEAELIMRGKE